MKLNLHSLIIWILFYLCKSAPPLGFLPNIIILYADDLGYGDLEGYGNPVSITPNLDKLIKQGTKLTAFYSASPVCSPSRAACLCLSYNIYTKIYHILITN